MKLLPKAFFTRKDVKQIAVELLGKIIITKINGEEVSVRIVETEAYMHFVDKASHAFNGRRTNRNEHMYGVGGTVYIYLCYGIHNMLNIVTSDEGIADAILIRAGQPINGIDIMLRRTGKIKFDNSLTRGPGNLGKALGINKSQSGLPLNKFEIFIYDDGYTVDKKMIVKSKRIGVDYAGDDALLEYRYFIKGNPFVSGKLKN